MKTVILVDATKPLILWPFREAVLVHFGNNVAMVLFRFSWTAYLLLLKEQSRQFFLYAVS